MLRSHKIRLTPNQTQANHLAQGCGVARFAWNWGLARWQAQYAEHKSDPTQPKPNEGALRRELNAIKRQEFPWMVDVTKCAPQEAIINLGTAFKNWFESLSGKRRDAKVRPPRFKKKGVRDSFKVHGNLIQVEGARIRIPKLGWVRMREALRFEGKVVSVTISRTAHAWFVAITVDTESMPAACESQAAVGVDLGVRSLAVTADDAGEVTSIVGPKALTTLLPRLKRLSRSHSRKKKGSANRKRSAQKLARLHWRIACIRQDATHKLTTELTSKYGWIAIEDLNVKGMMAGNGARGVSDAMFGELRRQLAYKAELRGSHLAVIDRWYPSSKTCHACQSIFKDLPRGASKWQCVACGAHHDRDENAAFNILKESFKVKTPGAGVSGCGEGGSDVAGNRLRETALIEAANKA